MSEVPTGFRYTDEHEYVRPTDEADIFTVGVTDYAQGELGDIVFLELPEVGDRFERGDVFGTIEAVKAVSDLYTPLAGEVVAVNTALDDDPALVNSDPYDAGWLVELRLDDPAALEDLLDADDYEALIG